MLAIKIYAGTIEEGVGIQSEVMKGGEVFDLQSLMNEGRLVKSMG